jgi:hypothetical protein
LRKNIPGIIIAILLTVAAYWRTLGYGFNYDDYHLARPWTMGELLQVLHSSWDPTRIEPAFYRPVTSWWYALRFELFGLNGVAQHAVSLAGMIACAWLAGVFVRRETGSDRTALFATGLYALHPALAYSQAVWLTNQMHVLASLTVLVTLVVWQRVRSRSALAWWPIGVLQIVAFGIKEDLVMLAPLLLALTGLRAMMRRDVKWPSWPVVVAGLALPLGLFAVRYELLGRLGGYGPTPTASRAWSNFTTGLVRVFRQLPAKRPWEPFVSAFSQTLLVSGAALGLFRRREVHLLLTGIVIAVAFDAPFVFVSKAEQYHLIALGGALALAGAIDVILSLVPARWPSLALAWALGLAALSFIPLTRNVADDFAPCSPITLRTDAIVLDWWVVPPEIQDWLRAKPAACREGRLVPLPDALTTATWAYGADVDEQGRRSQWTSDHAVVLVRPRAAELRVGVWRPDAYGDRPVTVRVRGGAADVTSRLTTSDWQAVTVPLGSSGGHWRPGMRRLDLYISPTFVPAEVDPASADRRHLGVRIRIEGVTAAR